MNVHTAQTLHSGVCRVTNLVGRSSMSNVHARGSDSESSSAWSHEWRAPLSFCLGRVFGTWPGPSPFQVGLVSPLGTVTPRILGRARECPVGAPARVALGISCAGILPACQPRQDRTACAALASTAGVGVWSKSQPGAEIAGPAAPTPRSAPPAARRPSHTPTRARARARRPGGRHSGKATGSC